MKLSPFPNSLKTTVLLDFFFQIISGGSDFPRIIKIALKKNKSFSCFKKVTFIKRDGGGSNHEFLLNHKYAILFFKKLINLNQGVLLKTAQNKKAVSFKLNNAPYKFNVQNVNEQREKKKMKSNCGETVQLYSYIFYLRFQQQTRGT